MKILKIKVRGLPLFEKDIEIDFFAKQRVPAEKNEMLTHLFANIYTNNVISMVGINASGKTTSLKVISFVLHLLQNKPINSLACKDILYGLRIDHEVCFEVYFLSEDKQLKKLETKIRDQYDLDQVYYIASETLWSKSTKSIRSKKELFEFSEADFVTERDNEELFLLREVSIMIAYNKKLHNPLYVIDSIDWTNINGLRVMGDLPIDLLHFLDPSIEYLECTTRKESNKKPEIRLKFYNKEEIVLNSSIEVSNYLSSGTIKGINIFMSAIVVLQKGGYIIIDELENHFNKQIVSTLIKFFMDKETNKSGAVLIFSTHYIELLDLFERNDGIFVTKHKSGINIENLADLLNRNDMKKSELFQSGYLENTTPSYESYINLKRAITALPEYDEE